MRHIKSINEYLSYDEESIRNIDPKLLDDTSHYSYGDYISTLDDRMQEIVIYVINQFAIRHREIDDIYMESEFTDEEMEIIDIALDKFKESISSDLRVRVRRN